jgi:peptidoglycan/xylan/chitin deacetylase (PgdA/CDA1 family)
MYHRIGTEPGPLVVSPESFSRQQELLAREYRVVDLQTVLTSAYAARPLPARAVLTTFDDGYRDNLAVAKPILDSFGHSATIFIPTDFISSQVGLPHDRRSPRSIPTLDWDELRALSSTFDVGSHGCSHRVMTSLSTWEAKRELTESKRIIEERLGQPVQAFSYPKGSVGDFNRGVERLARSAGYQLIFTTLPGLNREPLNPYRLKRHNVEDFGIDYFQALLNGSAALLAIKDTRAGYWTKRALNRLTGRG